MIRFCWWLADGLSRTLDPDEREAVWGDIEESGDSSGEALRNVLELVVRRQAAIWKNWQPWITLVTLVAPLGIMLSLAFRLVAYGNALPIWMYLDNWTWTYLTNPGARLDLVHSVAHLLSQCLTLICWSWASGLLLGFFARRAALASAALFCLVELFAQLLEQRPYILPTWNHFGAQDSSQASYGVIFSLVLQTVLFLSSFWGTHQGVRLMEQRALLRNIAWPCAIVTVTVLAIQNWGWVPCAFDSLHLCHEWALQAGYAREVGRPETFRIPVLSITLAGPLGYIAALAAVWKLDRRSGLASELLK